MKLSIIVPVYNEEKTIEEIIRRIEAVSLPLEKEIILVEDGSTDGTREILKDLEKKYLVIYHPENYGKGQAIRSGLEEAKGDIILIQDADLEYSPKDYPELLRPILENKTEVVFGSRYLRKNYKIPNAYFLYYLGNKLTNWLLNLLYGSKLTDPWTCYKVFKGGVLKDLDLKSNCFEIEIEMTVKTLKKKYKILEVPVDYLPRKIKEGKKIRWWRDGFKGLFTIIKYRIF